MVNYFLPSRRRPAGCLLLDGTADKVTYPNLNIGASVSRMSIAIGIKTTNETGLRYVGGNYLTTGDERGMLVYLNAGKPQVYVTDDGTTGQRVVWTATASIGDGAWHDVVYEFDAGTITVKVDGVVVAGSYNFQFGAVTVHNSSAAFTIGGYDGGSTATTFDGSLRNVVVHANGVEIFNAPLVEHYNDVRGGLIGLPIGAGALCSRPFAFPSAEGWGRFATGGRDNATIYTVTTLADSGAGSFRVAAQTAGNRIINFNIGGTITLLSRLKIAEGNLTIQGNTAPSDSGGVTFEGAWEADSCIWTNKSNMIIRYIRIRRGHQGVAEGDAAHIQPDASDTISQIIFDHCSFGWSTDEIVSLTTSGSLGVNRVSFNRCIFGPPLNITAHGYGPFQIGAEMDKIDYSNCIMMGFTQRAPLLRTNAITTLVNNLIFGCRDGVQIGDHVDAGNQGVYANKVNIVNNHFLESNRFSYIPSALAADEYPITDSTDANGDTLGQLYLSGNIATRLKPSAGAGAETDIIEPNYLIELNSRSGIKTTAFASAIDLSSAGTAASVLNDVLDDCGCNFPYQDELDKWVIMQIRCGVDMQVDDPLDMVLPNAEADGWPTLAAGTPWTDTTPADGMDDSYGGTATDIASDGYLTVEKWGHTLVQASPFAGSMLAGLEAHWDFSDVGNTTSGGVFTAVPDLANAHDLANATPGNWPAVASINGVQAGFFDGVVDELSHSAVSLSTGDFTFFCAFNRDPASGSTFALVGQDASFYFGTRDTGWYRTRWNAVNSDHTGNIFGTNDSKTYFADHVRIVVWRRTSGLIDVFENGIEFVSGLSAADTFAPGWMGSRGSNAYHHGHIGEAGYLASAATDVQVFDLTFFLAEKWGLGN